MSSSRIAPSTGHCGARASAQPRAGSVTPTSRSRSTTGRLFQASAGRSALPVSSDYGFLTILRSENVAGGLEVQLRGGEWIPVDTPPDSFVVNLGDMLEEWTDGRWVSTLHRVATPPPNTAGTRRQSLVFFHNPREDAYIDALGTTAGDYILAKAAQAFA